MRRANQVRVGVAVLAVVAGGTLLSIAVAPPGARADDAAATVSADERQIRELVKQRDAGGRIGSTDDSIFVSGRIPRRLIGEKEQREAFSTEAQQAAERARPNQKRETKIVRLVVARSGDVAYEFSDFKLSWDGDDKKPAGFEGSYLRAWRKVDGQWKQDAFVARPNPEPDGQ
jgi:ketosteroid isomerase-like protein